MTNIEYRIVPGAGGYWVERRTALCHCWVTVGHCKEFAEAYIATLKVAL